MNPIQFDSKKDQQLLRLLNLQGESGTHLKEILLCPSNKFLESLVLANKINKEMIKSLMSPRVANLCLLKLHYKLKTNQNWETLNNKTTLLQLLNVIQILETSQLRQFKMWELIIEKIKNPEALIHVFQEKFVFNHLLISNVNQSTSEAIKQLLKISYQTLRNTVAQQENKNKFVFQLMTEQRKKALIIKIIKVYSHTFVTEELTEFEYEPYFESLQQAERSVVCDLLTIKCKKSEQTTKMMLDFKIEAGLAVFSQIKIQKNKINTSLFNDIFKSSSGGYDFLKIQSINQQQKNLVFRFNLLTFEEDVFANLLPFKIMERGSQVYKDQIQKFNSIFDNVFSIIKKSCQGWKFHAYNIRQGELSLQQFSRPQTIKIVEICLLIWSNIFKLIRTFDDYNSYQKFGTYTKIYKRSQFQIQNLIATFTQLLNLEDTPNMNIIQRVCQFANFLKNMDSQVFNGTFKNKEFVIHLMKKVQTSIQKNKAQMIQDEVIRFLTDNISSFNDLGLKIQDNPLNKIQVFKFIYKSNFSHDYYEYKQKRKPHFYNAGEYCCQQRLPYLPYSFLQNFRDFVDFSYQKLDRQIQNINKKAECLLTARDRNLIDNIQQIFNLQSFKQNQQISQKMRQLVKRRPDLMAQLSRGIQKIAIKIKLKDTLDQKQLLEQLQSLLNKEQWRNINPESLIEDFWTDHSLLTELYAKLFYWNIMMAVNNRHTCVNNFQKYQRIIISLKKLQFELKQKMVSHLTTLGEARLQKIANTYEIIGKSLYSFFFAEPLQRLLNKFIQVMIFSGTQFITNFLTQGNCLINQALNNQTDYYCLRGYFKFTNKLLERLRSYSKTAFGIVVYQKFKKQLFGTIRQIYLRLNQQNNIRSWGWDINDPEVQNSIIKGILTCKRQSKDPFNQYHQQLKLRPHCSIESFIQNLFQMETDTERVYVNNMLYRGYKNIIKVQKSILINLLNMFSQEFSVQNTSFYEIIVKQLTDDIPNLTKYLDTNQEDQSCKSNFEFTANIPIYLGQDIDKIYSEAILKFVKKIVTHRRYQKEKDKLKNIATQLLENTPNKQALQKQKDEFIIQLIQRIQQQSGEQQPKLQILRAQLEWVNLFLTHLTKGNINKYITVSFIKNYTKLIRWLIGKGKESEQDLKLAIPLLQRLVPNLSQTQQNDQIISFTIYLLKIIVKAIEILQSWPQENNLFSLISKLSGCNSQEIVKYVSFFIAKNNNQQIDRLLCEAMISSGLQFSMEADIKGHFLKKMVQTNCDQSQIQTNLQDLIRQFKDKYSKKINKFRDQLFKLASKKIKLKNEQNPTFIYQCKDSFSFSRVEGIEFVNYKPKMLVKRHIKLLINKIVENPEDNDESFKRLKRLVIHHATLLPYIVFHCIKENQDCNFFLDLLIKTAKQNCLKKKQLREFIKLCCLDNCSMVKGRNNPIFLSYFIIGQIIKSLSKSQLNVNSLYLTLYLSQLKMFSLLCNLRNQQSQSLREKVQQFMIKSRKQFEHENEANVLCLAILSSLYRYDSIVKLGQKIQCHEIKHDQQYRVIQNCLLPFSGVVISTGQKRFRYNTYAAGFSLLSQFQGLDSKINEIKVYTETVDIGQLSIEGLQLQTEFEVKAQILRYLGDYCQLGEHQIPYDCFQTSENNIFAQLSQAFQKFYNLVEQRSKNVWDNYNLIKTRPNIQNEEENIQNEQCQNILEPTRFAVQDFSPHVAISNELSNQNQSQDQDTVQKFKKSFKQYKQQTSKIQTIIEDQKRETIALTEQMLQLIRKIKVNLQLLKKEDFQETDLHNKTAQQVFEMLKWKEIQTQFDVIQQTLNQNDFEAYCLANVSRLQKLTGQRRDKVKEIEEYMLMRYIRRTSSSDSIDYIIDTIDQNYQLLNRIDRKLTQRQEDIQTQKQKQSKSKQSLQSSDIDYDSFAELSQQLLFEIVLVFYNKTFVLQAPSLIPFLQNKRAQAKLVNTLLFVYRNPFDNDYFPKQLKHYGEQIKKELAQQTSFFKQRILKFLCAFSQYGFYQDRNFLTYQTHLDGIKGIKLEQNQLLKQFFPQNKHIPKIQILYQVLSLHQKQPEALEIKNKINFFSGIKQIPDCLVDKILKFLQFLNDQFEQFDGEEENGDLCKLYKFQSYIQEYKWYQSLKYALNNKKLVQKIRQKYPVAQQFTWNPFMFCLFIETNVYSKQELKKAYEIVLKRRILKSSSILYCNQGLKIYTDDEIMNNSVFKQSIKFLSTAFITIVPNTGTYVKSKNQPLFRLTKFPSLLTLSMKSIVFKLEIDRVISLINYNKDDLILAKRKKGIFQSAFQELRYKPDAFWTNNLDVQFLNAQGKKQSGYGGGVGKQWYTLVTKGMVNLNYGLFMKTSKNYYYFNRESWINPRHLQFFQFIGKLFALSFVFPKYFVSPSFSILIYKMILNEKIEMKDIIDEFDEGQYIINLQKMREITDNSLFCQTFVYTDKRLVSHKRQKINNMEGQGNLYLLKETQFIDDQDAKEEESHSKSLKVIKIGESIELVPSGAEKAVAMENLQDFIRLTKEKIYQIVVKSVEKQFSAFIQGFKKVISLKYLKIFTAAQLRQLAEGTDKIQIQQIKDNVNISVSTCTKCLELFWQVMQELSGQERVHFMHHWTGIPKVPADGLKIMKLQLRQRPEEKRIFAHTCFNRIYLPSLQTKEQVREAVLLAIATVKQGVSVIQD